MIDEGIGDQTWWRLLDSVSFGLDRYSVSGPRVDRYLSVNSLHVEPNCLFGQRPC